MNKDFFCSVSSYKNNDNLIGTASNFNKLLLIEYNNSFGRHAFKDSSIAEIVKIKITRDFLNHENNRVLLIKKRINNKTSDSLQIYAINNSFNCISVNRFLIKSYTDLINMDFNHIFSQDNYNEEIYLVCTNGKKDKCCGKFGMKIYKDLSKRGNNVWECSHIGGDRFAPNIFLARSFITYGHVLLSELNDIINSVKNKKIFIKKYRGNSSISPSAQAAETYLRIKYNVYNIYHLKYKGTEIIDNNEIFVFNLNHYGDKKVKVKKITASHYDYLTCDIGKKHYSFKYDVIECA